MIAKISLTAAFFLIAAPPPMACASNRAATNPAPITHQAHESAPGMVVAQDDQSNVGTSDNDNDNDNGNDSDSNDSADDNQNADGGQTDQQNAAGDDQPNVQPIAPQILNGPENDPDDRPPPNAFSQPINPNQ